MRSALLSLVLLSLAACGFQPVLAKNYHAPDGVYLPEVQVSTGRDRLNQLLKAEIEDQINPRREAATKRYNLKIDVTDTMIALFINPDGTASRGEIHLTSTYTLTQLDNRKVVSRGSLERVSSYNSSESADYATYVVREDARKRGVIELAKDYALRLASLNLTEEAKSMRKPAVKTPFDSPYTDPSSN